MSKATISISFNNSRISATFGPGTCGAIVHDIHFESVYRVETPVEALHLIHVWLPAASYQHFSELSASDRNVEEVNNDGKTGCLISFGH
jgi:hypothetical protein